MHATTTYLKIKLNIFWIYIVPVIFITLAFLTPNFVKNGECHSVFVTAQNTLFSFTEPIKLVGFSIYLLYYFGFILITCLLFIRAYFKEKNTKKQKVLLSLPLAIFLMSFPTFVLIILFPAFEVRFPSILCHFALLLAVTAFIGARYEHQLKDGKK